MLYVARTFLSCHTAAAIRRPMETKIVITIDYVSCYQREKYVGVDYLKQAKTMLDQRMISSSLVPSDLGFTLGAGSGILFLSRLSLSI